MATHSIKDAAVAAIAQDGMRFDACGRWQLALWLACFIQAFEATI